jgi:beta-N-acetylhexosaminidase
MRRRCFLRNTSRALAASVIGLPFVSTTRGAEAQQASLLDPAALPLEEKVGQLVVARLPDWPLMKKYARQGIITGLTPSLRNRPLEDVAELLNQFQEISKYPLLIGWGGLYSGGTEVRLNQLMRLGATRSKELCYQAARIEAEESRALGIHIAATPVLDVNTNPENPIINLRSLGDNVELVIELGSELARGTIDGRAASLLMHFPGHGATSSDSHIVMPTVDRTLQELERVDIRPFAEVIRRGLARLVCTNHCYYPAFEPDHEVPATVSRKIVNGLLRERLGFDGVIISDSLTMHAMKDNYGIEEGAIQAVIAGHDIILQDYQSDPRITIDALVRAVRKGRIPLAQIEASVRRVWKLKRWLGLQDNRLVDVSKIPERVATEEHKAVARRIARESVTVLENRGLPVPSGENTRLLVVSNGSSTTIDKDLDWKHSPGNHHFNQQVLKRNANARTITLSMEFKPEEIDRTRTALKGADVVVFGLFSRVRSSREDAIRLDERYRKLIRQAATENRTLVLCNFGNPWVLRDLPKPAVSLCTFSDAADSLEAAVEVLFGEVKSRGKLPVRLSADYPFGFGL